MLSVVKLCMQSDARIGHRQRTLSNASGPPAVVVSETHVKLLSRCSFHIECCGVGARSLHLLQPPVSQSRCVVSASITLSIRGLVASSIAVSTSGDSSGGC